MNSRDLLCAIAETSDTLLRESEQFSEIGANIKTVQKRQRQKLFAIGITLVLGLAVWGGIETNPQFLGN